MPLSSIVTVDVSISATGLTRESFGTCLFLSEYDSTGTYPSSRVTEYGSSDEVEADTEVSDAAISAASAFFSADTTPESVLLGYKLDTETWVEALAACVAAGADFYTVCIDSATADDIEAVAEWMQSRTKLYVAKTADSGVLDADTSDDVASTLLGDSYDRTGIIYNGAAATDYPDMAWCGVMLAKDPGSANWAFKTLSGITADTFTTSQVSALESKRCSRIETIQDVSVTLGGYVSESGMYLDLRRGIDYVAQRMAEDIFLVLTDNDKVGQDDAGRALVEAAIRARLQTSVDEGIFIDDDDLTVTVPAYADSDETDRAARILSGITWTANLVGAVNTVTVNGSVSV